MYLFTLNLYMYFNARSILPKIDELRALCANNKPNIVESWLDHTIDNNELCIENYVSVRADSHGGGVLIYIEESLLFLNSVLAYFIAPLPPSSPSSILEDLVN